MLHEREHTPLGDADILAFWTEQAQEHGLDPASSWSDQRAIDLEIATISRFVRPGMTVLDAGCATGYSTVAFGRTPGVRVLGIDYVPRMIELAQERQTALDPELAGRLSFEVGDVRDLSAFAGRSFDLVLTTRVLINLGTLEAQVETIRSLASLVRPGGLLLLSEATVEGWRRLNALRVEWGLPEIGIPAFNLYLDEATVAGAAPDVLTLESVENFASSYFVVTRVLKPLLIEMLGRGPDPADPGSELNRLAATLPAAGDYGTQKLFVLRRGS